MKKHIIATVIVSIFILMFSGCSQHLGYIDTGKLIIERSVTDKNYTINEKQDTYIGMPLIRVKDYKESVYGTYMLEATENFIFNTDGNTQYYFTKGDKFKIQGSWKLDGVTYTAVSHNKLGGLHLLIDNNGKIHHKIVNKIMYGYTAGEVVTVIYDYKYKPETVRLSRINKIESEATPGKINYELIYTGMNKESFMLTYREYTPNDMARSSFFQNLTYPRDSSKIRFKNLLLNIHSLDSQKITFTVLEDDLK